MELYGELQTSSAKWHYTNLSRTVAEDLLSRRREEGAFLVRDSETVQGASVLSTYSQGMVHHYRLKLLSDGKCKLEGEATLYTSLQALVNLCKSEPVLCVLLTEALELGNEYDDDGEGIYADADDDEDGDYADTIAECRVIDALSGCMQTVMGKRTPLAFDLNLQGYISERACSDSSAAKGTNITPGFEALLAEAAKPLLVELDNFTRRMTRVRDVFQLASQQGGFPSEDGCNPEQVMGHTTAEEEPFIYLMKKMQVARDMLLDTSSQTTNYLRRTTCMHNTTDYEPLDENEVQETNAAVFVVRKIEKVMGKSERITVNLTEGTVTTGFLKPSSRDKVYNHTEVLQLIKSRSNKQRLAILFKGKKRKDYLFDSLLTREDFCQKVHLMKLRHEAEGQTEGHFRKINVFVGSFNMGDAPAPDNIGSWFRCEGQGKPLSAPPDHDLIAVGTQESGMAEKEWLALIKKHIGPDYHQVAFVKLLQIRLVVLVKDHLQHQISHTEQSVVATGIANKLGNKGGVGVSFVFGQTSLCFINCHLAAGQEKMNKRNINTADILSKMQLGQKRVSGIDVASQFHHLFWFGDMNYRVNLPLAVVEQDALGGKSYQRLLQHDQLGLQRASQRVYFGFEEGQILFAPTYRYKRGTRDAYDSKKQKASGIKINVPSYTDRVLWKSFPGARIKQTSYGCTNDIMTSDHSPIFSTFEVAIAEQYVSASTTGANQCNIDIKRAAGKLRTKANARFILEIYAPFFQGSECIRSLRNSDYDFAQANPIWTSEDIPPMNPVIPDRAYLEHEHLLIAVKSEDGDELYGEASLSLMDLFGDEPMPFTLLLSHRGAYTGMLSGTVLITGAVGEGTLRTSKLFVGDLEDEPDALEEAIASRAGIRSSKVVKLRKHPSPPPVPSRAAKPGEAPALPPKIKVAAMRKDSTMKRVAQLGVCEFFHDLGLDHLAETFVEAGYDDLDFFADLEASDILDLGVSEANVQVILAARAQLGDA
eukprot:m.193725 g.193725  ORF g.193725 m.193725 type:complete len:990 (+) comp16985_c0_seq2:131-3100(+)